MSSKVKYSSFYLSEELIVEILKRLPVKSLLGFMSVCKHWKSLIKSPNFKSSHFNHQIEVRNSIDGPRYCLYRELIPSSGYYFVHSDSSDFSRHLTLTSSVWSLIPVGCCDGLFLFEDTYQLSVTLWNPSSGTHLYLVAPRAPSGLKSIRCYFKGIGFDAVSNDYKVIVGASIFYDFTTELVDFHVYSVNEAAWRLLDVKFKLQGEGFVVYCQVYLDGVIYWFVVRTFDEGNYKDSVLMYDIANETFSEILLPVDFGRDKVDDSDDVVLTITKWKGSEVVGLLHSGENVLDFLVLEDTTGGVKLWRKICSRDGIPGFRKFVNQRWNGEFIIKLQDGRLVSLCLQDMSMEHISDLHLAYLGPYIENLLSLILVDSCFGSLVRGFRWRGHGYKGLLNNNSIMPKVVALSH